MNDQPVDEILKELSESIARFKEMIGAFQQTDKRLDETASALDALGREVEVLKEQRPVDLEQTVQDKLTLLGQTQKTFQNDLRSLHRSIQSMPSGQDREAVQKDLEQLVLSHQSIKESIGQLNQSQDATQELVYSMRHTINNVVSTQGRWLSALALFSVVLLILVTYMVWNQSHFNGENASLTNEKHSMDSTKPSVQTIPGDTVPVRAGPVISTEPLPSADNSSKTLMSPESAEQIIKIRSGYTLTYLKKANFARLAAKYIHPEKGTRFFPSGLNMAGPSFFPEAAPNLMRATTKYVWKDEADTGSIQSTFADFYEKYVYDEDFLDATQIQFNEIEFPGVTMLSSSKIAAKFPDCIFVEYIQNGKSLVLVFERFEGPGIWYLVGVIHNN